MKETTRRDKPGLFTNCDWQWQSGARTALSASRFLAAACRQTAALLQHIEACGALPGIRCGGFVGDNDIEMAGGPVQAADMDSDEQSASPTEKANLCQYSGLTRFRFRFLVQIKEVVDFEEKLAGT
jgi:hypothetical protein